MSDQRCPRCGAARRPGDQWCGLCYADFREPPPPVVGDGAPPPAPVADAATSAPSAPAAAAPSAATPPLIRPPDQPGAVPPAGPAPSAAIPAQPVAPAPGVAAPFVPSTNPLAQTATVPTQLPEGVAPSAPPDPAAAGGPTAPGGGDPAEGLKWPCTGCGAQVPMAEDYCPDCGTGFLSQPVADKMKLVLFAIPDGNDEHSRAAFNGGA